MKKFGELFYEKMAMLSRDYLDLQQLRMSTEARIRKIGEESEEKEDVLNVLRTHHARLKDDEEEMLKSITALLSDHPIWDYCQTVKGFGPVAALTFLGYIDPYIADTAGKAKSYLGFIPGKALQAGKRARLNPEAKGRFWMITRNVIMAKDPFYTKLYHRKKEYYLTQPREIREDDKVIIYPPFEQVFKDPKKCPDYHSCKERLAGKAKRLGRKPKKLPCKAHCDNMAKRWLIGIIVSHATQIMRETEGLDVGSFKVHKNYISPPPITSEEAVTEKVEEKKKKRARTHR